MRWLLVGSHHNHLPRRLVKTMYGATHMGFPLLCVASWHGRMTSPLLRYQNITKKNSPKIGHLLLILTFGNFCLNCTRGDMIYLVTTLMSTLNLQVALQQEDFESNGDDDIEINNPAFFDPMTQWVVDQRDADVIEQEDVSDIFDPQGGDEAEEREVKKERLHAAWQKMWNKMNQGEKHATRTANMLDTFTSSEPSNSMLKEWHFTPFRRNCTYVPVVH